MIDRKIARRYAKALLIIAKRESRVRELGDELSALLLLMEKVKRFWEVVNNPIHSLERRKGVLSEVSRATGMSPPLAGLLRLLLEKDRLKYLPLIISLYHEMADETMGRIRAIVRSAMELTSEETERIRERLASVTGKEVIVETVQDSSLIGGMVTKIGGVVLDGSLKTQLERMRESLAKG